MILGVQLLGLLFGLFMIYYCFLNYKRKELSSQEFSFWTIVWCGFIIVTLIPQILNPLVNSLKLARTMDLFIVLGFIFLIGLTFFNYSHLKKYQRKLEIVVRKVAITNPKKGKE